MNLGIFMKSSKPAEGTVRPPESERVPDPFGFNGIDGSRCTGDTVALTYPGGISGRRSVVEIPLERQRSRAHRQHRRLSEPTGERSRRIRHERPSELTTVDDFNTAAVARPVAGPTTAVTDLPQPVSVAGLAVLPGLAGFRRVSRRRRPRGAGRPHQANRPCPAPGHAARAAVTRLALRRDRVGMVTVVGQVPVARSGCAVGLRARRGLRRGHARTGHHRCGENRHDPDTATIEDAETTDRRRP
jgi:hypothetical protein